MMSLSKCEMSYQTSVYYSQSILQLPKCQLALTTFELITYDESSLSIQLKSRS